MSFSETVIENHKPVCDRVVVTVKKASEPVLFFGHKIEAFFFQPFKIIRGIIEKISGIVIAAK
jgi:hypothetical protein